MNAGVTLNVKSIEIYLDATATLTSEGLAEGALQVQDFRVKWTFDFVKLRRGSGKDWQGMAHKAKGLKA